MSDGVATSGYPDGRTRRVLETLAGRGSSVPTPETDIDVVKDIVSWFFELRKFCTSGEFGRSAIQPSLVSDWCDMTGDFIPYEFRSIIIDMDVAFRSTMSETDAYFNKRNK